MSTLLQHEITQGMTGEAKLHTLEGEQRLSRKSRQTYSSTFHAKSDYQISADNPKIEVPVLVALFEDDHGSRAR